MVEGRDRPAAELIITPAMIADGVAALRRAFGGETEGANRFVDFAQTAEAVIAAALIHHAPSSSRD